MTTANEFRAGGRIGLTPGWSRRALGWLLGLLGALSLTVRAADVADVRNLLRTGEYDKAITQAAQGLKEEPRNEEWPLLLTRGLLTVGRYPDATAAVTNALAKDSRSIRLRCLCPLANLTNFRLFPM